MRNAKILRDPIHTTLSFDLGDEAESLALRLIDAPEVQRLRHIRQLGLANFVYHGAEHSRFSHTLGATHLARRLYRSALDASGSGIDPSEYALLMAAAVLHDIGHAPFSHALEKVFNVKHEQISTLLVRGDSEIHRLLDAFGGAEFLEEVAAHIAGASDKRTVSIISSQLDADRADYVLRDGYFAGIPNAQYDLERIVQKSRIDQDGLLFDLGAQQAIEGYFIARYHLYIQLYYHATVRSAESLLRTAIKRAKDLRSDGVSLGQFGILDQLFSTSPSLEHIAQLTDSDLWAAFRTWADGSKDQILKDLSSRLVHRRLFKTSSVPAGDVQFGITKLPQIASAAKALGFDPEYYVLFDTAKDTPYKITDPVGGEAGDVTRLVTRDGKITALEVRSRVVKALQEDAYQINRVCYPEELRNDVEKIING